MSDSNTTDDEIELYTLRGGKLSQKTINIGLDPEDFDGMDDFVSVDDYDVDDPVLGDVGKQVLLERIIEMAETLEGGVDDPIEEHIAHEIRLKAEQLKD